MVDLLYLYHAIKGSEVKQLHRLNPPSKAKYKAILQTPKSIKPIYKFTTIIKEKTEILNIRKSIKADSV